MENRKQDLEIATKIKRKNTEIGNEEELHKLCNSYVKFIKLNSGLKYSKKENEESRNTNHTSRTK